MCLQRGKEALQRGIIPAVGFTAHATGDAVLGQEALVMVARVWAAAVRMRQQPLAGQTPLDGQRQSIDDQAALQAVGHQPAHHAPGEEVLHDGRYSQPARVGM